MYHVTHWILYSNYYLCPLSTECSAEVGKETVWPCSVLLLKSDELPSSQRWTFFEVSHSDVCEKKNRRNNTVKMPIVSDMGTLRISLLNLHELSLSPRNVPMLFPIKEQQFNATSLFMWCKFYGVYRFSVAARFYERICFLNSVSQFRNWKSSVRRCGNFCST